jgi:hypothetical protein
MECGRSGSQDHDINRHGKEHAFMHAVPPEGPLRRDDRDEPAWIDEPSSERNVRTDSNRRRAAMPTVLLVAAVVLIVALIVLL